MSVYILLTEIAFRFDESYISQDRRTMYDSSKRNAILVDRIYINRKASNFFHVLKSGEVFLVCLL